MTKITFVLSMAVAVLILATVNSSKAQDTAAFKPSGNVWGYVFGDYYYKTHSDSLGRGAGNVQYRGTLPTGTYTNPNQQIDAIQVRRAYLGYDYNISKEFSVSAVLAHEEGPNIPSGPTSTSNFPGTNLDAGGSNTVFLKYLYLKWANVFKGSNLIIGQQTTPSFATPYGTEPLWGYRSVERTIMDMHNIDASSDMAVSLVGSLWTKNAVENPAFIGYQIQVGDGNSAKPENDRFKKYRGTVFVSALHQKLTIGVYGDHNTVQIGPVYATQVTTSQYYTGQATTTMKGYIHFKVDEFRVGFEIFQQINKNADITLSTATSNADTTDGVQFGWSAFASARIIKNKLNIFARTDMYNPDTKFNSNNSYVYTATAIPNSPNLTVATFYTQTFYTAGLDWTPNSRVHIMPNVWYNQYKTMPGLVEVDANNNFITPTGRAKSDYDLVYRVTFYFIFNSSKKVSNNGMDY